MPKKEQEASPECGNAAQAPSTRDKVQAALKSGKPFSLSTKAGKRYVIFTPAQIAFPPQADYLIVHDPTDGGGKFENLLFDSISAVEPQD